MQQHTGARPVVEYSDDTGTADAVMHLKPASAQPVSNLAGRLELLMRQLGMFV